ncbi:MAG TPA: phospholipase D family protein [Bryobacteraceae bacterium]|nr:phospholipase D family protein [Bryobacteraceae bacterium]
MRTGLREILRLADQELVIASPYIKTSEAEWVCDELARKRSLPGRVQVLTDVRSTNVLGGSLDIAALRVISNRIPAAAVVNLPRLHAKVYVADRACALVTSANLTPSGMDINFEFGVESHEPAFVEEVRRNLDSYARLGNVLRPELLAELQGLSDELCAEFRRVERSATSVLRRRFSAKLRAADYQFLRAQVGTRSAQGLFSEAILYALSASPLSTTELHPRIQRLLPDLCDDSVELVINGEQFGKRWKHAVRNAQQYLKRTGRIVFDGERWSISRP